MIKRKCLLIMTATALSLSLFFTSYVNAAPQSKRLCGNNRYETCSAILEEGWKSSCDYAVLVNGEDFPDALCASILAKKYNAPILLTQNNTLDENSYNQLKRLKVKQVFIVGGDFVVKSTIENSIKDLGIQVKRYEGLNRNHTSVEIAKQIGTDNGVILATDKDFADALSVSPIAAKLQIPILLMPKDTVPKSVKNFINSVDIPKTYVLGGLDLISDNVASEFPNVQRIDGKDKYERNINIINAFSDKFNFDNIYFAYSEKFADALSGSALAALNANPIILMGDVPTNVTSNFIQNKINSIKQISVLGGTADIKDSEIDILINSNNTNFNNSHFNIQQKKDSKFHCK